MVPSRSYYRTAPSRAQPWLSRGGEVVVREIVRETVVTGSVPITFPMLTRSNYNEWALIMECNLHAASLRVPMKDDTIERKEDKKAVAALMRATP